MLLLLCPHVQAELGLVFDVEQRLTVCQAVPLSATMKMKGGRCVAAAGLAGPAMCGAAGLEETGGRTLSWAVRTVWSPDTHNTHMPEMFTSHCLVTRHSRHSHARDAHISPSPPARSRRVPVFSVCVCLICLGTSGPSYLTA